MLNFSKFLPAGEAEVLIIYPRSKGWHFYFYLFLIVLLFFLLYPLWRLGSQGLILWFLLLIIIILFLASYLLKKNTYYLLTTSNLWHIFYVNENKIRSRGKLPLNLIESIEASGDDDIIILADEQKFILFNIKERNVVLAKLKDIILPKIDKSVII